MKMKIDTYRNRTATRVITTTIGIIIGIAGFNHGFFEALQGFKPTEGLIIQAIGESIRWWKYGTEEAFTIIPNYLITGIASMVVSITIIIWSINFVQRKLGPTTFLLLCILLFLVGGGIGQILFFTLTWAYATRLTRPIDWWGRLLPKKLRIILSYIWIPLLSLFVLLFLIGLEIAIFGFFPGVYDPEELINISWGCLLGALILINLIYISGFAYDIENMGAKFSKDY
jgi:hypothetical protein